MKDGYLFKLIIGAALAMLVLRFVGSCSQQHEINKAINTQREQNEMLQQQLMQQSAQDQVLLQQQMQELSNSSYSPQGFYPGGGYNYRSSGQQPGEPQVFANENVE